MPRLKYDYALIRVVPRVERGELMNAGAIVYCRERRFLGARVWLDRARLALLAPGLDLVEVQAQLELILAVAEGGPEAGALGELSQVERFRWLTSPRSTVVQISPVHPGLCADPAEFRRAYVTYLLRRLEAAPVFLEEALHARSLLV